MQVMLQIMLFVMILVYLTTLRIELAQLKVDVLIFIEYLPANLFALSFSLGRGGASSAKILRLIPQNTWFRFASHKIEIPGMLKYV
jgi:hypothetical protein